jgi:hypothetical protein
MVDVILLLLWTFLYNPSPESHYSHGDTSVSNVTVEHIVCSGMEKTNPIIVLLVLYKLCLMLVGLYLASRCWHIAADFSEAKNLAYAIYSMSCVGIIAFVFTKVVRSDVNTLRLLEVSMYEPSASSSTQVVRA